MTKQLAFRYRKALLSFTVVIIAFVAGFNIVVISRQREAMRDEARKSVESELSLIGTLVEESLLRRDYVTVESFLGQWAESRENVLLAKAVAPNGFVLARYFRQSQVKDTLSVTRDVEYEGKKLVTLETVIGLGPLEREIGDLNRRVVMWSILLAAAIGGVLWRTLQIAAFRPLEAEIGKRGRVESELREHRDRLDEMVKERTKELTLANTRLREEIAVRELIEEKIRASEEELSSILKNMQDMYFKVDKEGRLIRVTPSVARLLDYHVDDALGRKFDEFFMPPEDFGRLKDELETSAGLVTNFEARFRRRDGGEVWGSINAQYCYDEKGAVAGVEGAARDITEIKSVEEAVRLVVEGTASETGDSFFRSLVGALASSTNVLCAFTAELAPGSSCRARTISLWINGIIDNVEYELGGTPCEEVYKGKVSFYPDNVQELFPDDVWLKDIKARSYLGIPFFNSKGEVIGHLGVIDSNPFTDRRRIEPIVKLFAARAGAELERLKAEKELNQFKKTLDMTLDCVFMFDPESLAFFYVNQGAMDQVGYSREELISMTPLDLKIEYSEEDFRRIIEPLMKGEKASHTFETTHRHKNGDLIPVEVFMQYVSLPGEGGRFLAIVRDIADRKRAEDALRHTQKLESLGILAGGIAHDFNNILVGILGNANMALEDLPSSSSAAECVEDVIMAAKQAADLAKQMLAYSGKGKVIIKPVNLTTLINEMGHLLEVSVSKRVSLKYNLEKDLPLIEGDPSQIRQVVMNLVINASEAIGEDEGEVVVKVEAVDADAEYLDRIEPGSELKEGVYVALEVVDNGCGMDQDTLERIFDPFYTTKFTGRGLGLAAVLGIVRGHGGALRVDSESGRGAVFKALFPADELLTEPLAEERRYGAKKAIGGVVLIVDDENTIRNVAKKMLSRAGYEVVTAVDGKEGVELFSQRPEEIDVVLLDMTMPRMDGVTAFMEIRKIRPDARVILSSGYNEHEAASRFAGKGLAGFIQKPYTSDILLEKIGESLEK